MEPEPTEPRPLLQGGPLLAAISTSIVAILREHYGRGPVRAKTYALDDIITVVMRGSGFTALEQTMMESGEPNRVVDMRHEFQGWMTNRYEETIEQLTGRKVVAFSATGTLSRAPGWRSSSLTSRSRASAQSNSSDPTNRLLDGRDVQRSDASAVGVAGLIAGAAWSAGGGGSCSSPR